MRQSYLAIVLVIAGIGQAPTWAAEEKGHPPFDPRTARLACVAGRMTVWTTSDLVEATKMHRAQSFTTRYRAQRVGGREAVVAYELTSTHAPQVLSVFGDGMVLLRNSSTLIWARAGQPPAAEQVKVDGVEATVLAAWEDGVVMQPNRLNTNQPIYFAPYAKGGRAVDTAAKVRITDEQGLDVNWQRQLARGGNRIAWLNVVPVDDPRQRFRSVLHVYDLKARRRKDLVLKHPTGASILAFDGGKALLMDHLVDVETAEEVKTPRMPPPVAMRAGHAYRMAHRDGRFVLEAVELDENGEVTELLGREAFEMYEWRGRGERDGHVPHEVLNRLVIPLDEAMRVWTGKEWQEVKYLK